MNFGLDAAFLNQRLNVSAEYYISKTSDVLTDMPIALSTGNQGGCLLYTSPSPRDRG